MLFWPIFGNFWCPVVALLPFSSNLSNFKKNPKKEDPKQFKKIQTNSLNPRIKKSFQKSKKNQKSIKPAKNHKILKNGQKITKNQKISKTIKICFFSFSLPKKTAMLLVFQY